MQIATIIIASLALIISIFTFLRDYILPAKIDIFVGDSLQIVRADRNKIQLNFNLTNPRNKLSVVNRLEAALVISPTGIEYAYEWNLFYKLEAGSAKYEQFPTSIAVLAKSSVFQGIEFISSERFKWVEGRYDFNILGWSNRGMKESGNIEKKVSFSLGKEDVEFLNKPNESNNSIPLLRPIKIIN